ncbi:MAG: hypothetical protein KUL75_02505 [Sterolibacterium sp.]|nr:hypothetical protein [Sterolibacterium sp.]
MKPPPIRHCTINTFCGIALCLACGWPPPADSASAPPQPPALGRLFYSPQARQAMQHQRKTATHATTAVYDSVKLDGLVRRSSGHSTLWLNQQAFSEADASSLLGHNPPHDSLRIGETLAPASGQRFDLLPQGSLSVRRQP